MNPIKAPSLPWIGASYQLNTYVFTLVAGAAKQLLGANPRRWSLWFLPPQTGNYVLNPKQPTSVSSGATVSSTASPLILLFQQAPALIGSEWWAISTTTPSVNIWEIVYLGEK